MSPGGQDISEQQGALLRLIAEERFAEFQGALATLVDHLDSSDSEQLRELLLFLERALIEMRTRRAHLAQSVESLQSIRSYLGPRTAPPGYLSIVG